MARILLSALLALLVAQGGCATSTHSHGRDFSSESVAAIVRGKTTSSEASTLFGQPYQKTLVNETDERWLYLYTTSSATARSYIVKMNVESTLQTKMLTLLIRNGIVLNYTFTDGSPSTTKIQ